MISRIPMPRRTLQIDTAAAERRIRPYVRETKLEYSPWLSALTRARVYLKLENLQETGSFKLRGAANKLLSLPTAKAARGVVTGANANHAFAVAAMACKLGIPACVFACASIDSFRRKRIRVFGATVHHVTGDRLAAEQCAREEGRRSRRVYVSAYNDREVIAGQGTIAIELLRAAPGLDAVFMAVGGGALAGGIGAHLKAASPATQVVGCWPVNAPAIFGLRMGRVVDVTETHTPRASTASGLEADAVTLALCHRVIDRAVLVTEEEILVSLRQFYRQEGRLIESAAAVAVAGFRKVAGDYAGQTVAVIIGGGNVDPAIVAQITAGSGAAHQTPYA